MSLRKVIPVLLRGLLLAAVAFGLWRLSEAWPLRVRASSPEAAAATMDATRVQRGPFVRSITTSGKLRARTTVTVRLARMRAKLTWIAPDGVPIKEGAVLARFDDTEYRQQVRDIGLEYENARAEMEKSDRDQKLEQRNSQAAVEKAEEEKRILVESNRVQLAQAQAEVDFKKAELERLTTEYERKKSQAAERLIPAAEVEVAEIAMKSAAFAADKAEKDLSLQIEKTKSDLQQKETDLENALFTVQTAGQRLSDSNRAAERRLENIKRRLDEAKEKLGWCIVRAPTSGLVVMAKEWRRGDGRRVARPGDELRPGSELANIPDLSAMAVDCKVAERDIGRVKRGQTVIVRLDERPKEPHYGRVSRISSVAEAVSPWDDSGFDAGTRVFTVTVELRGRAGTRLLPGMSASLEIVTQRIPDAVFVPKSTVFNRGADHVVYVRRSGRYHPVAVTLGQENATHVCIRSGLQGGEWVATTDPMLGRSESA